jgi:hypothetical protein
MMDVEERESTIGRLDRSRDGSPSEKGFSTWPVFGDPDHPLVACRLERKKNNGTFGREAPIDGVNVRRQATVAGIIVELRIVTPC